MKNFPRSTKIALAAYMFLPWLFVVMFQFIFIPISWVSALMLIGPIWVFIAPVFTFVTVATFVNEAVRIERAKQALQA